MIGKTVSHYRILERIGSGGMGDVFKAEDTRLSRLVAIKFLPDDLSNDTNTVERFRREARAASGLNHPNICTIHDVNEEGEHPFLVMEFLKGETLKRRLSRGPLPLPELLELGLQIVSGLDAAHAEGILHRDIKPGNILVTERGQAKILDFGLAKLLKEGKGGQDDVGRSQLPTLLDVQLTEHGATLGTIAYMSPEQARGEELDVRSDLFSMGAVLYEMATGRQAFEGDTAALTFDAILNRTPKSPSSVNPAIPFSLIEIIDRLLNKDRKLRYQTATRLRDDLVRFRRVSESGQVFSDTLTSPAVGSSLVSDVVRPAVAVLSFRNLSQREDVQWLSVALAEMLTTELAAGEGLRTVPGENINRMKMELALPDANSYAGETLALVRQNLGAELLVFGSYVTVGEGANATLRVDVRLQDSRAGDDASLMSESGRIAELFDVVARVGTRVLERLGFEPGSSVLASARASQPESSSAAKFYAEGLLLLRRFDTFGAREALERAIQSDPKFPLAHSALATAWSALGYDGRARESAQRAFELSANLPRMDRLVVEGTYRQMASMWPEAIAIWETLRTAFPDDVEHALRLAKAQTASGAAKEGLATIENFRQQFPGLKDPRLDLVEARAAETLSDFKRMKSASAAAAATAEAQGARLLVAAANLCEGGAAIRLRQENEAIRLFENARSIFQAGGDRGGVAHALNNLAIAISDGPQIQRTRALYEEGLAIARAIGKQDLVARFLNNMAIQERHAGNFQVSLRMNQESLAIRREIGDRTNLAVSLNNIGNVLLDLGDLKNASQHYEESAAMSREIGDRSSVARALYNAAECFRLQGMIRLARDTNEESLRIRRGIDDPSSLATSLAGLGQVAMVQGELTEAKALLSEAIEMDRRMDRRRPLAYSLFYLAEVALIGGDLATARRLHLESLDLRTQLGEKGTAAESRTALAVLAIEEGQYGDGEDLARGAAAAFEGQEASDNQATARAAMALAMAAQGRQGQALHEVDRAVALVQNTQNVLAKLSVEITAERIRGALDHASASTALKTLHAQAVEYNIARSAFEAARALAQIENARSPATGAERLATLRSEAQARGFGLFAR